METYRGHLTAHLWNKKWQLLCRVPSDDQHAQLKVHLECGEPRM